MFIELTTYNDDDPKGSKIAFRVDHIKRVVQVISGEYPGTLIELIDGNHFYTKEDYELVATTLGIRSE